MKLVVCSTTCGLLATVKGDTASSIQGMLELLPFAAPRPVLNSSVVTQSKMAQAIFYTADVLNIQYRADAKMSRQSLHETKLDVSECQPLGVEWLALCLERPKTES